MFENSNFALLAREEERSYFVYFKDKGWVHSDHLLHGEEPNEPFTKRSMPDRDYGMKALPKGCNAGNT